MQPSSHTRVCAIGAEQAPRTGRALRLVAEGFLRAGEVWEGSLEEVALHIPASAANRIG